MYFASAFDSKIIAMHPRFGRGAYPTHPLVPVDFVPVFDVGTHAFNFCPRAEIFMGGRPIYMSSDKKLFAMCGALQVHDIAGQWCNQMWYTLPDPPFESEFVTSYALHPDGLSFFMSIGNLTAPANFSFNMRRGVGWQDIHGWGAAFQRSGTLRPKARPGILMPLGTSAPAIYCLPIQPTPPTTDSSRRGRSARRSCSVRILSRRT